MYDEVMQLIALAKNDEVYFKRIEDLKQKMLELAQVKEIAATLNDADMHLANARQKASILLKEAEEETKLIKASAESIVAENKQMLSKTKAKQVTLDKKEQELATALSDIKKKELELQESINEHRKLTQLRTIEMEKAAVVKTEFETKLRKLKELAAS